MEISSIYRSTNSQYLSHNSNSYQLVTNLGFTYMAPPHSSLQHPQLFIYFKMRT